MRVNGLFTGIEIGLSRARSQLFVGTRKGLMPRYASTLAWLKVRRLLIVGNSGLITWVGGPARDRCQQPPANIRRLR
jgi:hypothetical protein